MERSDVRWQKRRKNRCGKPCTVHIAKDPGYLGRQPMSMGITTWIRRNTCMYAAAILPVIHTLGHTKKSMRPMGTMADSNLRNKRIEAHRALDAIWKNGYMTKHSTYIWLQNRLNLREKDTHIGKFSYYLCEQTIRECTDYIKSREEKKKSPDKISVA